MGYVGMTLKLLMVEFHEVAGEGLLVSLKPPSQGLSSLKSFPVLSKELGNADREGSVMKGLLRE